MQWVPWILNSIKNKYKLKTQINVGFITFQTHLWMVSYKYSFTTWDLSSISNCSKRKKDILLKRTKA